MLNNSNVSSCTAFNYKTRIASGDLRHVALKSKEVLDNDQNARVLIFDDITSEVIEIDFRGTPEQLAKRMEAAAGATDNSEPASIDSVARRPGRPKLGVVAREITLLPRHWEWLARQPSGASVALRKLVEQAIKANRDKDSVRRAQNAAYRFMSTMAGNEPAFEEAIRALFSQQSERFLSLIEVWPADVREHAKRLAVPAFPTPGSLA